MSKRSSAKSSGSKKSKPSSSGSKKSVPKKVEPIPDSGDEYDEICCEDDEEDVTEIIEDLEPNENEEESNHSISEICYENIDKEGKYKRGKLGRIKIVMNSENEYINATQVCKEATELYGVLKKYYDWKRLDGSKSFIKRFSEREGIPSNDLSYKVKGGRIPEIRGTYVHPKMIPIIAAWASDDFAVDVCEIVTDFYINQAVAEKKAKIAKQKKIIKEKNDKIDELNDTLKEFIAKTDDLSAKNDEMLDENKKMFEEQKKILIKNKKISKENKKMSAEHQKLSQDNKKISEDNKKISEENQRILAENREINKRLKALQESNNLLLKKNDHVINMLEKISEARVVSTGKYKDQHLIVIIQTNYRDENNQEYYDNNCVGDYYGMRIMRKSLSTRISEIKAAHPFMEIIEYIPCEQSSMNIWHHVRDTIGLKTNKDRMINKITNNYFNMHKEYSVNEFISKVKEIYNDRLLNEDDVRAELESIMETIKNANDNEVDDSDDETPISKKPVLKKSPSKTTIQAKEPSKKPVIKRSPSKKSIRCDSNGE